MSSHSEAFSATDSEEGDLVQGSKKVVLIATAVLVATVLLLVFMASLVSPPESGNPNLTEKAVTQRIQKVGALALQDNSPREAKTGEQVFTAQCSSCHTSGALGAPKFGDKAAWSARVPKGFAELWNSALRGKNAMPAQGGDQLSDLEVARGVVYLANASGAKFPEPKVDTKPAK